jgi:hypothetical protein
MGGAIMAQGRAVSPATPAGKPFREKCNRFARRHMTNTPDQLAPAVDTVPWSLEELAADLAQPAGGRFALLDACDEPLVPAMARMRGERAVSLYRGWAEQDYWAVAPYLFELDQALVDWIVENLWESPWGMFVAADAPLDQLRKHFRRFLEVKAPDGRRLYFRFYDPRVLPTFLTTCTAHEAERFFGPVQWFGVGGAERDLVLLRRKTVQTRSGR